MFNEKIPPFGGWDGKGCTTVLTGPVSTICECYHFGTYAVLAEMIEPPGYPEEWSWLEIVANVGYGVSIFSLLLFILGIVFKRTLLRDMFYILRLSFAGSYLVGLISMWVADLTTETILEDRHNNIAISALQSIKLESGLSVSEIVLSTMTGSGIPVCASTGKNSSPELHCIVTSLHMFHCFCNFLRLQIVPNL